jgi:ribosomal protein S30
MQLPAEQRYKNTGRRKNHHHVEQVRVVEIEDAAWNLNYSSQGGE